MENSLVAGDVSQQTHDSIVAQMTESTKSSAPEKDNKVNPRKTGDTARAPDAGTIAGLLLGSPEFQRR